MTEFSTPTTLVIQSLTKDPSLARLFTLPVIPDPKRRRTPRISDKRYIEGQKLLVEAMKYLVRTDADANREAIGLLSEHFRTQFRMSDRPVAE
jgi:hypothetical protein